jgi:hypothetical protein
MREVFVKQRMNAARAQHRAVSVEQIVREFDAIERHADRNVP